MNTFCLELELARVGNHDILLWFIAWSLRAVLDRTDEFVSFEDFAKDDMAAIEPSIKSTLAYILHVGYVLELTSKCRYGEQEKHTK